VKIPDRVRDILNKGRPGYPQNKGDLIVQDEAEDTEWGSALLQKVIALEEQAKLAPAMANRVIRMEEVISSLQQAVMFLSENKAALADVSDLVSKAQALKTGVLALTDKLDSENVTNLDTDYTATVSPLLD
jgi:hypothetical protein